MDQSRLRFFFLNLGHGYAHFFMLLYPTVVLALEIELGREYGELLLPLTAGFVTFAAATLPAGWLGDRWSREGMLALMFLGLGAGAILAGVARTPWELAAALAVIGLFAAIYHPVGIAMVVETAGPIGRALGINGVFGNLGVAAAPLTAGLLSGLFGWRFAFLVPAAVALVTGLAFLLAVPRGVAGARPGVGGGASMSGGRARVVVFLVVAALFGGMVFHVTTISLPKLLGEKLGQAVSGPLGAGGLASLVFACAAFAQLAVGWLIDRYPIRPVALCVTALQVPLFILIARLTGWPSFAAAFVVMFLVFGGIPLHDTLIARYSAAAWRARLYALKYLLSLGVAATAVPLIALLHEWGGGFSPLFLVLAMLMVAVAVAALALPARQRAGHGAEALDRPMGARRD